MAAREGSGPMLGYCRVSTADQAESGAGLAAQEAAIRSEAERRGWQLADVIRDEGASGTTLDRPGLSDALARIARGEADGLVVAKLDRASRSAVDAGRLLDWFERAGATFVALDMGLSTDTAAGRLTANVLVAVAQWEADVVGERTRDGLAAIRAAGRPISRASVADRPEIVKRIAELHADGASMRAIADALNAERVPTLRGGAQWRVSAVQGALGYRRPKRRTRGDLPGLRRGRVAAAA